LVPRTVIWDGIDDESCCNNSAAGEAERVVTSPYGILYNDIWSFCLYW
jgi:hypothetical protein